VSDAERAIVDTWSGSGLFLGFDDTRAVRWDSNETTGGYYRWAVDPDGTTSHIRAPDGTEKQSGTSTLSGDTLKLCATSHCWLVARSKV
jgi:hypothetical protein